MTQVNEAQKRPNETITIGKPIFFGAGIGLVLISFFLIGVKDPNPEWGKFWMVKPLLIVPIAGAIGGAFYYFIRGLSYKGGLNKTVAVVLSLIIYIIGLWLGVVLGLSNTLWD
jgi:hypothetical protein